MTAWTHEPGSLPRFRGWSPLISSSAIQFSETDDFKLSVGARFLHLASGDRVSTSLALLRQQKLFRKFHQPNSDRLVSFFDA
jgi:hypothetical protein